MSDSIAENEIAEAYREARVLVDNPFISTKDEKLEIIEFLAENPSAEAVDMLAKLFEMVRIPLANQQAPEEEESTPRGGEVSGNAARLLPQIDPVRGVQILVNAINGQMTHPYLRESAVYGLGGVVTKEAIAGIAMALEDSDAGVRKVAVLASQETLKAARDIKEPDVTPLVIALIKKVITSRGSISETEAAADDGPGLARHVLSSNMTEQGQQLLSDILLRSDDGHEQSVALDLLAKINPTAEVFAVCADCLLSTNRHPVIYSTLGDLLRNSRDRNVQSAARKILKEKNPLRMLGAALNADKAEVLKQRKAAARKISPGFR